MVDDKVILAGAIPAAILALAADVGVGQLERRLRPQ
jgi:ABC-type proline/glycine betaine transport system permease subunit